MRFPALNEVATMANAVAIDCLILIRLVIIPRNGMGDGGWVMVMVMVKSDGGAGAGLATTRRILLVLTQSVWPSITVPSQRVADGLTTDRRILLLLVLTQSVWPSSNVPL